uniref:Lecithin-cholesterol acyltransferase-like 4 n=1 Tax=Daucus carota subsp. sativus TaxID=79200 RepID=A0A166FW80_DAUCS
MAVLLEDLVRAIELWLKLLKKPEPYVDPNLDPVLLVPGIAGSILKAVDDKGKEERVWVRIFGSDRKSVSLDQKTNIVVPEDRDGLYAIDVLDPDMIIGRDGVNYFHDMIVEMTKWGYQEGKTLFGFGYDFRQSNRFKETLEQFAAKLELMFTAAGGKKINIISHSMGGLLVKCFMSLHSDLFERYVKNWIAIAAPFQGAPGYVTSSFLNGMSFVEGWQQNFFVSKWHMHQLLIECPSLYELMACPDFSWEHVPLLQFWKENLDVDGNSSILLESYSPVEAVSVLTQALSVNKINYDGADIPLPFNLEILKWANETKKVLSRAKVPPGVKFYNIYGTNLDTPHTVCYGSEDAPITDIREIPLLLVANYVCVDGDGTVPMESAKADGLDAVARVGVPGEHRGILCDRHVFRIVKHWLKADHDPFYNPINDYVILPTSFEIESHQEKGLQVTSLKEEWEILTADEAEDDTFANSKPMVGSIAVSHKGDDQSPSETARATLTIHPQSEGKQHIELNAVGVSAGA